MDKLHYEKTYWQKGFTRVAGVDEAGRGPLAGPVVAAAVIFAPAVEIAGVEDSKQLTRSQREALYPQIVAQCLSYGVGIVGVAEIDRLNIYYASMQAMKRALGALSPRPQHVLVDGRAIPELDLPQSAIVKGDAQSFTIAAASIIAKVVRDCLMLDYHRQFPQYGFAEHKGYPTPGHYAALRQFGPCAIHRRSFNLVENVARGESHVESDRSSKGQTAEGQASG